MPEPILRVRPDLFFSWIYLLLFLIYVLLFRSEFNLNLFYSLFELKTRVRKENLRDSNDFMFVLKVFGFYCWVSACFVLIFLCSHEDTMLFNATFVFFKMVVIISLGFLYYILVSQTMGWSIGRDSFVAESIYITQGLYSFIGFMMVLFSSCVFVVSQPRLIFTISSLLILIFWAFSEVKKAVFFIGQKIFSVVFYFSYLCIGILIPAVVIYKLIF